MIRSKLLLLTALAALISSVSLASAAGPPAHSVSARAVPVVRGRNLLAAYVELHRDGFRVTFTHAFSVDWSGACVPVVTSSTPAPSRSVPPGFTVILSAKIPACGAASPGHPVPLPGPDRVPSFSGKPLSAAIKWIHVHDLFWAASIPALRDGNRSNLYANYVITAQSPRPGSKLTVGVTTSAGGWLPTPLRLRVRSR